MAVCVVCGSQHVQLSVLHVQWCCMCCCNGGGGGGVLWYYIYMCCCGVMLQWCDVCYCVMHAAMGV